MAHELDFSKGQAAIAFRGQVPWHGYGESILPEDSVDDIRIKAGLDYDVVKTPVLYDVPKPNNITLAGDHVTATSKDRCVLYRSDTGDDLSVVSNQYQVVQPREVVDFYRDLTEKFGFELEVVGALKGGRKVWALANTNEAFALRDDDKVKGYLLLATSYDGTMATQARFTSVRVVCNNTLTCAVGEGRADISVPHSTKFDANRVKAQLGIGEGWDRFKQFSDTAQSRIVTRQEQVRLLMAAYYGLDTDAKLNAAKDDEKQTATIEKFMERMTIALHDSPGAKLRSANGTLWGLLNAVTYDLDHAAPARTQENRLNNAWFGKGESIKRRALSLAEALVA